MLGRVYEYLLSQFASAEGKKGGEFYTPRCVVKLLVEMLDLYRGRVYDLCCGSAGMVANSKADSTEDVTDEAIAAETHNWFEDHKELASPASGTDRKPSLSQ